MNGPGQVFFFFFIIVRKILHDLLLSLLWGWSVDSLQCWFICTSRYLHCHFVLLFLSESFPPSQMPSPDSRLRLCFLYNAHLHYKAFSNLIFPQHRLPLYRLFSETFCYCILQNVVICSFLNLLSLIDSEQFVLLGEILFYSWIPSTYQRTQNTAHRLKV